MAEQFKKSWSGWATSSDGFSVRLMGRSRLDYRDGSGTLRISAEAMSKPWNDIVVHSRSIPDLPERPRAVILDRLGRAFAWRGWRLTVDDA